MAEARLNFSPGGHHGFGPFKIAVTTCVVLHNMTHYTFEGWKNAEIATLGEASFLTSELKCSENPFCNENSDTNAESSIFEVAALRVWVP